MEKEKNTKEEWSSMDGDNWVFELACFILFIIGSSLAEREPAGLLLLVIPIFLLALPYFIFKWKQWKRKN